MSGFVSFVSSGPGDPELLTLKAVARLKAADAVLFDDLSSGPILAHARPQADLVSVGKRAGRTSPKQHHVSRLLVDYAMTGARVVRLKSGDAGLFGRLEEETVALAAAGIGYEIIPGVPSACAAAAAAGIPLTRRLLARPRPRGRHDEPRRHQSQLRGNRAGFASGSECHRDRGHRRVAVRGAESVGDLRSLLRLAELEQRTARGGHAKRHQTRPEPAL
jgi:precorrin-4 methylase